MSESLFDRVTVFMKQTASLPLFSDHL